MHNNINVSVGGPVQASSTYRTVVLKGNIPFAAQIGDPNTKYVIKWDFDLGGATVEIPEGCILEFDGGSLKNGTIIGQDTVFINVGDVDIWGENLTREGTWREKQGGGIPDKEYDPEAHSGLGRKTLELKGNNNILTQEDFNKSNTIYIISYDFDLDGATIAMPDGCVLDFEGGSISNGALISNKTYLESPTDVNSDALHGTYYTKDGYLNYNQKKAGKWDLKFHSGYITPGHILGFTFITQSIAVTHDYIICLGFKYGVSWNQEFAIFVLFDRNYNFKGSAMGAVSHCNDCTVYQDKLYVACSGAERVYSQVHVYNLQDIIDACLADPDIRHTSVYSNPISPVQMITTDETFFSIDYDPVTDEFGVVLGGGVPALYDATLTVRKKTGSVGIETDLGALLGTGVGNQSCIYKKGVMNFVAWYHKFDTTEYGVLLMVVYDFNTDKIVDYQPVQSPYSYCEPEGAFKDPDDDNNIYLIQTLSSDTGCLGTAIGTINQTENTIAVSDKTEKTSSIWDYNRTRRVYVDINNTDKSDGGSAYPWKRLDEAIIMTQGFAGNIEFNLFPSRKTYYLPDYYKFENGKRIGIRLVRYSGDKPENWECHVEGAVISYGGILDLIEIEWTPSGNGNIHIGRGGTIIAEKCVFRGKNNDVAYTNIINVVDGAEAFLNSCTFNDGNTAVRLSNGHLHCYNTKFNSCQTGINAQLNSTIETVVSVDDIEYTNVNKGIAKGDRNRVTYIANLNEVTDLSKFLAWAKSAAFDNTAIGFYVSAYVVVDTDYILRRGEYVYSNGFVLNSGTGYPVCDNRGVDPIWYRNIGPTVKRPAIDNTLAENPAFFGFPYFDTDTNEHLVLEPTGWVRPNSVSPIKTGSWTGTTSESGNLGMNFQNNLGRIIILSVWANVGSTVCIPYVVGGQESYSKGSDYWYVKVLTDNATMESKVNTEITVYFRYIKEE